MEVEWIADRAALRSLAKPHPEWTQRELADAVGRSLSWIKKWLKRLREAPPDDLHVLLSHSRAHHAPYPQVHPRIIQRIVEMREQPPENLHRTPGPRAILYYLHRDKELQAHNQPLPRSTRTSLSHSAEMRLYPGCASSLSPTARTSRAHGGDPIGF